MVKQKVGGGKRYKAALKAKVSGTEPKWDGPAPPTHMQKKITRKVNFLGKLEEAQKKALGARSAGVKKASKKKRQPLPDLSSLDGVLAELQASVHAKQDKVAAGSSSGAGAAKPLGACVKSAKERLRVGVQECARVHQVLQHPAFIKDPIAAITNHLSATLPTAASALASAAAAAGARVAKKDTAAAAAAAAEAEQQREAAAAAKAEAVQQRRQQRGRGGGGRGGRGGGRGGVRGGGRGLGQHRRRSSAMEH